MKITQIKTGKNGKTFSTILMEELVTDIRKGIYQQVVTDYRELLAMQRPVGLDEVQMMGYNRIPSVCFAALWKKSNGTLLMKEYNKMVLLEITNLPSHDEACRVRKCASQIPYTRLAYVGTSGRDVVIVCAIANDGLDEASSTEKVKSTHLAAYKMLHYLYSSQLLMSVDNKEPRLDGSCMVSADSEAFYNPDSEPISLLTRQWKCHYTEVSMSSPNHSSMMMTC